MQRVLKGVAVVGLFAAALVVPAQAQQRVTLGLGGGVSIPSGSTSDALKTGWNVFGAVAFKPAASPVGFQVDGNYQELKFDPSGGKDQVVNGTGNIVYWFPVASETRVRPYVLAGGGIYYVKAKPDLGASSSDTRFGINGGAGFDFTLQPRVGVFVEGRFHNVFFPGTDFKYIPITAGVRFGG